MPILSRGFTVLALGAALLTFPACVEETETEIDAEPGGTEVERDTDLEPAAPDVNVNLDSAGAAIENAAEDAAGAAGRALENAGEAIQGSTDGEPEPGVVNEQE